MTTTASARSIAAGQVVRLPVKPSRVKLTSKNALALPGPGQGDARMFYDLEVPGLALMITSTGHRTYIVTGRTVAGRSFRLKLGTVGPVAGRGGGRLRAGPRLREHRRERRLT
jgi:hypothetical protein